MVINKWFANIFREEGTRIIFIISFFNNLICKKYQLFFKSIFIPLFPNILKNTINIHFLYTKAIKM